MRTLGFRSHTLLALAGAAGLALCLLRPWYAPAPAAVADAAPQDIGDVNGPLNGLFAGMQRWLTGTDGVTGADALDRWGLGLGAMCAVAALGALLCLVPVLQSLGRDLLRYGALAAFAITAWKLFDPPGDNADLELRYGALAATGSALVLLACGLGSAQAPLRKRKPTPGRYQAPPPPVYSSSGSAPPPGL